MSEVALASATREIVVDEIFPYSADKIWRALTDGDLVRRWMPMEPAGFEAVEGNEFTYQTTPGGSWDGIIRCKILEVVENERLAFSWKGGHPENQGYGAPLDTIVTFTLEPVGDKTLLRLTHSGFVLPRNETAYSGMSDGWPKVVHGIGEVGL